MSQTALPDVVLVVDDEDPVRKTFVEWLEGAGLGIRVLQAPDAAGALVLANQNPIDLAVLDWNLGAGNDGLKLLEDLYLFHPDVVAILVTGFAHQATPLDAMRMGVRDYLDKNQELDRETFLRAVRRQLDLLRPAKRERRLHQGLAAFREAVEKVLPLVRSASALTDPVPLPEAIGSLFRFLMATTGAADGLLVVRRYDAAAMPPEVCRVYDAAGRPVETELAAWPRSVAGAAAALGGPHVLTPPQADGSLELQPLEQGRKTQMAAPMAVGTGVQAVLEMFDRPGGFTEEDSRLAGAPADFGAEMLRQALARRQTDRLLVDAVEAALRAGDAVSAALPASPGKPEEPPPAEVLDRLRVGLRDPAGGAAAAEESVRLAEAVRALAVRHGPAALRHCTRLVEDLRGLLDSLGHD